MTQNEEKKLAQWFEEYVDKFADRNGKLTPMLKLKLVHSRRVAKDAAGIACDLEFVQGDVRTARMLGLFHDIGRFDQFQRHQTFRDELSFNHGRHGAKIMAGCPPLLACAGKDIRRIIAGICHHNRANLPAGYDKDTLNFIKIGRDADKLDIFHVLYHSWKNNLLRLSPDITLRVKLKGKINPLALNEIRRKKAISAAHLKSLADFFLLQLSWVYDINFVPTFRRMSHRKVIEHIAEVLPRTAAIKEQILAAKRYVKARLAGNRLSCR